MRFGNKFTSYYVAGGQIVVAQTGKPRQRKHRIPTLRMPLALVASAVVNGIAVGTCMVAFHGWVGWVGCAIILVLGSVTSWTLLNQDSDLRFLHVKYIVKVGEEP